MREYKMLKVWTALNYCLHNSTHWHTWPFRIKYSRDPYNNVWWILIPVLEPKTAWQEKDTERNIQALFFSNGSPLRRLLKLGGMRSGILALQREGLKTSVEIKPTVMSHATVLHFLQHSSSPRGRNAKHQKKITCKIEGSLPLLICHFVSSHF